LLKVIEPHYLVVSRGRRTYRHRGDASCALDAELVRAGRSGVGGRLFTLAG